VIPKKPCPLPYILRTTGDVVALYKIFQLSPNGQKLLIGTDILWILDLKTAKIQKIDFSTILPKNMYFKGIIYQAYWCPYDNNKFVVTCYTGTDTIGDGKSYIVGYQLISVNLDSNNCEIVTPKMLGKAGVSLGLGFLGWLPESSINNNFFVIGYISPTTGDYTIKKYNSNYQTLETYSYYDILSYSYKGSNFYYSNFDSNGNANYYLNNVILNFPAMGYSVLSKGDFSPSGKKLAVCVKVENCAMDSARLDEIWIIDVDKYISNPINPVPIKIINLRDNFCMFTYQLNAVFTSETTLALSMFKDGDKYGNIYEIDINGNMVRQLTFVL